MNCFKKLYELGIVDSVSHPMGSSTSSAHLNKCGLELYRLFSELLSFKSRETYYPDSVAVLDQIYKAAANEINARHE